MPLDFENPVPLYIQIVNDIKTKIESGELQPGTQLPSQQELAKTYSVSLMTVKKALADLNKDNYIYTRVGKGAYVARKSGLKNLNYLNTIGFVLRDLDSPFFSKILTSAEKTISEKNYNLLLASTGGESEKEETQIRHFLEIGVMGLIIASMSRSYHASPVIRYLQKEKFPYVFVSYIADEDIAYVGIDHEAGAFMATEHLIHAGYDPIGYINGEEGNLLGELRKNGLLRALRTYGKIFYPEFEFRMRLRGEWNDFQSGYEIGQTFLGLKNRPRAMFAYNDLAALGFEKAVMEGGLSIPTDVALVGFDNIKRSVTAPVPLTTVNQPGDIIGRLAVEIVEKKIQGLPVADRRILKPELIVRESCGAGVQVL